MPRRNRVTPFGEIVAVPERGTMMGNRGVLHDAEGRIRRPWQVKRWLICLLEFRGRHRVVMAPGRYTELFFLDEATGLAAGHRPCSECRRGRFLAFRDAWAAGNGRAVPPEMIQAGTIDDRLHAERVGSGSHEADIHGEPRRVAGRRVRHAGPGRRGRSPRPGRRASRLVAGRLHGATATPRGRVGHGPDARDRPWRRSGRATSPRSIPRPSGREGADRPACRMARAIGI